MGYSMGMNTIAINGVSRETITETQERLNRMPLHTLGSLLTVVDRDYTRSGDSKLAAFGAAYRKQVLFAMSPEFDHERE